MPTTNDRISLVNDTEDVTAVKAPPPGLIRESKMVPAVNPVPLGAADDDDGPPTPAPVVAPAKPGTLAPAAAKPTPSAPALAKPAPIAPAATTAPAGREAEPARAPDEPAAGETARRQDRGRQRRDHHGGGGVDERPRRQAAPHRQDAGAAAALAPAGLDPDAGVDGGQAGDPRTDAVRRSAHRSAAAPSPSSAPRPRRCGRPARRSCRRPGHRPARCPARDRKVSAR